MTDFLMIPGPTPLPEQVRAAMASPAVGHRSAEFKEVLKRVLPRLKDVFRTSGDVLLYTASGTGAMEAALSNTLNPGDKVLCLTCGVFSARFAEIGETLGLDVERMDVPAGEANSVEALRARLQQDTGKAIKAVTLIHSETSTSVLNPVKEMAAVIREHGALVIVDAVTSLLAAEFRMDDWGIDIAVSGSQKGFMIPPGLSFLALNDRAWAAHKACKAPGYYFNFSKYKKAQDEFTTPYTPATHLILGLDAALAMVEEEGLDALTQRHGRNTAMVRAAAKALGLELLVPDERYASKAATAILPPAGVSVADIRAGLKKRFSIVVADGQKDLKGKIFRIGHLGHISERDVYMALAALEQVLGGLGYAATPGAAVAAAQQAAQTTKAEGDACLVS